MPGRPRKAAEELRSKRVRVRFTAGEVALIHEMAEGRPLAGLLRELLLEKHQRRWRSRIPIANLQTAGQLSKLGNNVNQLVRLASTGRLRDDLEPLLGQLYGEVAKYRRDLLRGPQ